MTIYVIGFMFTLGFILYSEKDVKSGFWEDLKSVLVASIWPLYWGIFVSEILKDKGEKVEP